MTASQSPQDAALALDGRMDTRWSTGKAQRKGDVFEVDLGAETTVGSVHLWQSECHDQFPLFCSLAVARAPGQPFRTVVERASVASVYRTCLLDARDARFILEVPPTRCRRLRLTVQVPDRLLYPRPWSIAELAVYPPAAPPLK